MLADQVVMLLHQQLTEDYGHNASSVAIHVIDPSDHIYEIHTPFDSYRVYQLCDVGSELAFASCPTKEYERGLIYCEQLC